MEGENVESRLELTKAAIRERQFTTIPARPKSGIYLFFSFDLVNSTQFKLAYPGAWPKVIIRFYEDAARQLHTRFQATIWKYIGDEVLLFAKLRSLDELFRVLPATYQAIQTTTSLLHREFPQTRELLAVKGTVWIARAEPNAPSDIGKLQEITRTEILEAKNIVLEAEPVSGFTTADFLGPEIDTGFRLSKFALRKRLVVSADLAWLLSRTSGRNREIEKQLRIVSLVQLKGVWSNRAYPIIWYEPDWKNVTFLYDEHLGNDIVSKICDNPDGAQKLIEIEKIFSDLGREDEMEKLAAEIENLPAGSDPEKARFEITLGRYAEVHCVAVCFSKDGHVLAARRPSTKRRFKNRFEFGCGQLRLGESFQDCLLRTYMEDFGIKLNLPDPLTPVTTFIIPDSDENRNIPGLIFFGEIVNKDEIERNFSREKHSDITWIDPRLSTLNEDEFVPDFARTLRSAFTLWEAWNRERATTVA